MSSWAANARRDGSGLIQSFSDIPGHGFINPIDWMIDNALPRVMQVAPPIDVIELTIIHETIDNRRPTATAVGSEE
jgi:hypothetical protein